MKDVPGEKEPPSERARGNQREFLGVDASQYAVDSLQKFDLFLGKIDKDNMYLIWAILAAYHSLYGFLICNLQGTDYYRVLEENPLKKDRHKLIGFADALNRIQDPIYMTQNAFSKPLELDESDKKSLLSFHKRLRNNLIHFIPIGWSIEYSYVFGRLEVVINTIEKLAFQTGNLKLKLAKSMKSRTEEAINNLRRTLGNCMNK